MDSSQLSLSSEWDIVSSYTAGEEDSPSESITKESTSDDGFILTEKDVPKDSDTDNVQKGSCVDDLPSDPEDSIHNDSASDIDVIDEIPDITQCKMPIPMIDYSFSSSLESRASLLTDRNDLTPPVAAPEVPAPSPGVPAPSPEVPAPSPKVPAPSPGVPVPSPGVPAPSPEVPAPSPKVPAPSPGVPVPSPGVPAPSPEVPAPSPRIPAPSPRIPAPSPRVRAPSPRVPAAVPSRPVAPRPPAVRQGLGFLNHPYIQLLFDLPWHDIMRVLGIVLLVMATLRKCPDMEEMKTQLVSLQAENNDLKNQVISKIEDDKLFIALEDQIKALKGENSKLSSSLKSLILKLEEQTAIFQKENSLREKDPYKSEIDKLKEQVNVLQIDNDELQKQLVRMRYGAYSPYAEEAKPQAKDEPKDKVDQKDEKIENASEILSEEIKELRKKLYSEVEKLKEWKESVHFLMKKLSNIQEGSDKPEGQDKKSNRKDRRFHERMWKALKNNFKGTLESLPNIEFPDVFSKYVDQKKVEDVFESVGHYFKKAQEKTKKIFDYNEEVKNNIWDVLGDLRKKWGDVKNEFFERNYGKGESSDESGNKAAFSPDRPARSHYESDKKHKTEDYREAGNDEETSQDSWMFERAAHRSELRENEQEEGEDASSNWFLRKRVDAVNE